MHGLRAWKRCSGALALATERNFEREVLPFLRLLWPSLQQVRESERKSWDAKGIDLLVWADRGLFPCIVQCKGFRVQRLGYDQIRQTEESIEKFRKSDVSCYQYLLVHNRDARFKEFNSKINERLKKLVSEGKAKKAALWDQHTLLREAFDRMKEIINDALRQHSRQLLNHFQSLFDFGHYYIPTVPVAEKRLIFKRDKPCSCKQVHPISSRNVRELLLSPSKTRWTLLTGRFGTGKTTAVLHAATSSDRVIILVPCATLPSSPRAVSTNKLFGEILKSLKILDDFDDQDRSVLYRIAGPVFAHLLRRQKSPYAVILDGLDENRAYTDQEGLQQLSNQLVELNCPIVMTTRAEHLDNMFGDFSSAFYELSTKKRQNARLFELAKWDKDQVLELVNQVLIEVTGAKKKRLSEFVRILKTNEYINLYDELPFNPLFLQFILEDVVTRGVQWANRCVLLRDWVKRKIWRDRHKVKRIAPGDSGIDVEDFCGRMITLMENVANLMTSKANDVYQLVEFIDSVHIRKEAEKLFNVSSDPLLGILLNSVLVPQSLRRESTLNVTFAFRVFHVYFLASYLVRKGASDEGYPDAVKSFYSEIKSLSPKV